MFRLTLPRGVGEELHGSPLPLSPHPVGIDAVVLSGAGMPGLPPVDAAGLAVVDAAELAVADATADAGTPPASEVAARG